MAKYVVGFVTDKIRRKILLIRKNRPEFQKGLLNGPGGKIEEGESEYDAMEREFKEETGIKIPASKWTLYCTLIIPKDLSYYSKDVKLFFFHASDDAIWNAKPGTDEGLELISVQDLLQYSNEVVSNLNWLIPMFLTDKHSYTIGQHS